MPPPTKSQLTLQPLVRVFGGCLDRVSLFYWIFCNRSSEIDIHRRDSCYVLIVCAISEQGHMLELQGHESLRPLGAIILARNIINSIFYQSPRHSLLAFGCI